MSKLSFRITLILGLLSFAAANCGSGIDGYRSQRPASHSQKKYAQAGCHDPSDRDCRDQQDQEQIADAAEEENEKVWSRQDRVSSADSAPATYRPGENYPMVNAVRSYPQPTYQPEPYEQKGYSKPGYYEQNAYNESGSYEQNGYSQSGYYEQNGYYESGSYEQNGYSQPGYYEQNGYYQPEYYEQNGYCQPESYDPDCCYGCDDRCEDYTECEPCYNDCTPPAKPRWKQWLIPGAAAAAALSAGAVYATKGEDSDCPELEIEPLDGVLTFVISLFQSVENDAPQIDATVQILNPDSTSFQTIFLTTASGIDTETSNPIQNPLPGTTYTVEVTEAMISELFASLTVSAQLDGVPFSTQSIETPVLQDVPPGSVPSFTFTIPFP